VVCLNVICYVIILFSMFIYVIMYGVTARDIILWNAPTVPPSHPSRTEEDVTAMHLLCICTTLVLIVSGQATLTDRSDHVITFVTD